MRFSFRNLTRVVFLTNGKIVYKNPLKRSVIKSQFQNPQNLYEKKCFFFSSHTKATSNSRQKKGRSNLLSNQLLGGSLEVPTKYDVKIKMI